MHGDVWVCVYEVCMRCVYVCACIKCVSGSVYGVCVCVCVCVWMRCVCMDVCMRCVCVCCVYA